MRGCDSVNASTAGFAEALDVAGKADVIVAAMGIRSCGGSLPGETSGQPAKPDPDYVFSRQPDLFIPEDRVVTGKPQQQTAPPSFPDGFADDYVPISVDLGRGWFQLWVRRDSAKVGGWL